MRQYRQKKCPASAEQQRKKSRHFVPSLAGPQVPFPRRTLQIIFFFDLFVNHNSMPFPHFLQISEFCNLLQ